MGFLEILTLIFVVMKLMGNLDWTWFQVFTPMVVSVVIYLIIGCVIFMRFRRR